MDARGSTSGKKWQSGNILYPVKWWRPQEDTKGKFQLNSSTSAASPTQLLQKFCIGGSSRNMKDVKDPVV